MSRTERYGGLRDGSKGCRVGEAGFEGLCQWWWRWGDKYLPPGPTKRQMARMTGERDRPRVTLRRKKPAWVAFWQATPTMQDPDPKLYWIHARTREKALAVLEIRAEGKLCRGVAQRKDLPLVREDAKRWMASRSAQLAAQARLAASQALVWEAEGEDGQAIALDLYKAALRLALQALEVYPGLGKQRLLLGLEALSLAQKCPPGLWRRVRVMGAVAGALGMSFFEVLEPRALERAVEYHRKASRGDLARQIVEGMSP